jgi:GH15 family glucan-1,4-alpha-glucosidase
MEHAWNHARGHFVDRYGDEHLDAALLLLPLVGSLPADDPRMAATIDAIEQGLGSDGHAWRTPRSGATAQGAFIACSCWPTAARCRTAERRQSQSLSACWRCATTSVCCPRSVIPDCAARCATSPQALSHLASTQLPQRAFSTGDFQRPQAGGLQQRPKLATLD